jgi:DNA-binding transcriptional regulator YiaG
MTTAVTEREPEFKDLVLGYRDRHALTQAAAAKRLGVPHRTWQDWEYGRRTPRGFALQALKARLSR